MERCTPIFLTLVIQWKEIMKWENPIEVKVLSTLKYIYIYIYIYIYVNYMNAHVFIYVCRAMCGKVAVIIMCIAS